MDGNAYADVLFTFQYGQIKTRCAPCILRHNVRFTFQYGQIKTGHIWHVKSDGTANLHSNMDRLKLPRCWQRSEQRIHLHSNMDRLKLKQQMQGKNPEMYLHSNMDRLKLDNCVFSGFSGTFTFQYGQIKTTVITNNPEVGKVFTFQYGQIKTCQEGSVNHTVF